MANFTVVPTSELKTCTVKRITSRRVVGKRVRRGFIENLILNVMAVICNLPTLFQKLPRAIYTMVLNLMVKIIILGLFTGAVCFAMGFCLRAIFFVSGLVL